MKFDFLNKISKYIDKYFLFWNTANKNRNEDNQCCVLPKQFSILSSWYLCKTFQNKDNRADTA